MLTIPLGKCQLKLQGDTTFPPTRMARVKKTCSVISVGEDIEKSEPSNTADENVKRQLLWETA